MMNDIMLEMRGVRIIAAIDDLDLNLTWSDDPTYHYIYTLRDKDSYARFKQWLNDLYNECKTHEDGIRVVNDLLQTEDIYEFVVEGSPHVCIDPRTEEEIDAYLREAEDKVWLMRNCCISSKEPQHEASRSGMNRIFATYSDIPKDGYDTWECGYWNGIMGTLRWVIGLEKNFLDT